MPKGRCVLIAGNPTCGFRFIGPFDDFDAATEAANRVTDSWWIATLEPERAYA